MLTRNLKDTCQRMASLGKYLHLTHLTKMVLLEEELDLGRNVNVSTSDRMFSN
jgi:hypothetical protein